MTVINIQDLTEYNIGELIYFFEKACAMSGYILGVNPFNQPGVEAYKKNMMDLLKSNLEADINLPFFLILKLLFDIM